MAEQPRFWGKEHEGSVSLTNRGGKDQSSQKGDDTISDQSQGQISSTITGKCVRKGGDTKERGISAMALAQEEKRGAVAANMRGHYKCARQKKMKPRAERRKRGLPL